MGGDSNFKGDDGGKEGCQQCFEGKKKYCWIGICVVLVLAVIIGIVAAVTGGGKVPKLAIENC